MRIILLATFIAFTACIFPLNSAVCAQSEKSCNFDEQLGIIYHEADIARGRLAEQQIEILNQIETIANKCKDKPVREQLNHDDNAKFTTLMQRRNIIDLGSLETNKGSGLDLSVMTCYKYCHGTSAQN